MVTGSIYPCFLSALLFIIAVILIIFSATPIKIPSFVFSMGMIGVSIYSAAIIFMYNTSRMWYLSWLKDTVSGRMTGFMQLEPGSLDFYNYGWAYGLIICLFILFISTSSIANKYYACRFEYIKKEQDNSTTTTPRKSAEKESLKEKVIKVFSEIR
jgi:hypothetical protein